ncbi:hypothetical protein ACN4EG_03470 [Alkalinema pantanalense CENA528]|uniref:hypothetical protein n=1 Tax=Alkalinema pantanalense TaxID=1620705 RepID=UPI003D6F0FFC
MLVVLVGDQLISPQQVCQNCLMADQSGQPRWHGGRLRCGNAITKTVDQQPRQFQCQMGFKILNVE